MNKDFHYSETSSSMSGLLFSSILLLLSVFLPLEVWKINTFVYNVIFQILLSSHDKKWMCGTGSFLPSPQKANFFFFCFFLLYLICSFQNLLFEKLSGFHFLQIGTCSHLRPCLVQSLFCALQHDLYARLTDFLYFVYLATLFCIPA